MSDIKLYTIGFTKKTAEQFFTKLKKAGVKQLIDVRLNNISQLAGFAKKEDLKYFLKTIADISYLHLPELAPTQAILDEYKKNKGDWGIYEKSFLALIQQRKITEKYSPLLFNHSCLLCSESTPDHCHRRLVAEYLSNYWKNMTITHIL